MDITGFREGIGLFKPFAQSREELAIELEVLVKALQSTTATALPTARSAPTVETVLTERPTRKERFVASKVAAKVERTTAAPIPARPRHEAHASEGTLDEKLNALRSLAANWVELSSSLPDGWQARFRLPKGVTNKQRRSIYRAFMRAVDRTRQAMLDAGVTPKKLWVPEELFKVDGTLTGERIALDRTRTLERDVALFKATERMAIKIAGLALPMPPRQEAPVKPVQVQAIRPLRYKLRREPYNKLQGEAPYRPGSELAKRKSYRDA